MATGAGTVAGIGAWGVYLPSMRAQKSPQPGAPLRTAGDWDEDSFTMALEAGRSCLRMHDERAGDDGRPIPIEAVLVARSTEPSEAGSWALITALGLGDEVRVLEFPADADGPADALDIALAQVEAGRLQAVLIVGASCRHAAPQPNGEAPAEGDGAAAVVVSRAPLLELVGRAFANLRFFWSGGQAGDLTPARFEQREIIEPGVYAAAASVLGDQGWSASEIDAWELSSPTALAVGRRLRLEPGGFSGDQPFSYAGAAEFLLRLAGLCGAAQEGHRLLALNVGERAWAYLWKATGVTHAHSAGERTRENHTLDYPGYTLLAAKARSVVASRDVDTMDYLRESDSLLRLEGTKCRSCSRITAQSSVTAGTGTAAGHCDACGGPTERVALARRGTIRSFTRSHIGEVERVEPTIYTVCDLDGGARLIIEVAEAQGDRVEIGQEVRLVLRCGYRERGRSVYLWKAVSTNG